MGVASSAKDLALHRSTLGRFLLLELLLAVAFMLGFGVFLFDRLDYVLERRDRQIVTRELDKIAQRDDVNTARRYLAALKKDQRRIAPDIVYALVSKLGSCRPLSPLAECAEETLWMSEHVRNEPIDFAGVDPEAGEGLIAPGLARPSGPRLLRATKEFVTDDVYYQARRIGADGLLMVGIDRTEILKEGRILLLRSTLLFTVFLVATGLLAAWAVTRMRRRITRMNATLEQIGKGSLEHRIALAGTGDEIDTLGRHINGMLVRIDDLVESLQRLTEQLEQRNQFIRKTFGRYLTDEVVATLLESPTGLKIGGEKRKITMMMTDLRGFTSLSEHLGPERVVAILNRYLSTMVNIIKEQKGTIDEFIGDAIFVLFGAPFRQADQEERAVACAVRMQLAMDSVNAQNRRECLPEIEMGIGIHTGEVVVGNIGSIDRMKYGVVGSDVNFTSRVQSYCVGGQIIVSQATREAIKDILEIGRQLEGRAKGIEGVVTLFEVLGIRGAHNLFLPERSDAFIPLSATIAMECAVVSGVHLSREQFGGQLTRLSARRAWAQLDQPVAEFSDLRMHVMDDKGSKIAGAMYGKVISSAPGGREFLISFTAMSAEIEGFLQKWRKNINTDTPRESAVAPSGEPPDQDTSRP